MLPLVNTANPVLVLLALIGTAVFMGVYGPLAALFAELLSPEVRYSGSTPAGTFCSVGPRIDVVDGE